MRERPSNLATRESALTELLLTSPLSRRRFLHSASAFALAAAARPTLAAEEAHGPLRAYVGTYTGTAGNGEGIYLFDVNAETGELTDRRLAARAPSPSWITVSESRKFLYAVNEVDDFHGGNGSVSAFAIEPEGGLKLINTVSSEGAGPAHMSLDATGKFAFVANYGGGSIAVLPIQVDGSLGAAVDVHRDKDSLGDTHASNAPEGSFAISGHDAPHAHMIAADPKNRFVLATDLGQDRLYVYRFNTQTGKLTPAERPFVALPTGDGPRHFAFHPDGRSVYVLNEESSTIVSFRYDDGSGTLTDQQTISALPEGFAGTSFASEIAVAPNGKTLYAANRLHDTIAVFSIARNGRLERLGETSTLGDYPVQFRIDPTGRFLFVCNRRSDAIVSFRIDRTTGQLATTGQYTAVGSPGSIAFVQAS